MKYNVKLVFYDEDLLAPRPTSKLDCHPLSAVSDCLFNMFAATLHIWKPFPQPANHAQCHDKRVTCNTEYSWKL